MGHAFEFVAHTADIAARVSAPTLSGLFEAGAAALVEALTEPALVRAADERRVRLSAPDAEMLLVDWLHELLYLFETEGFLAARTELAVHEGSDYALDARVWGERRDESRHPLKLLIKAVTYHGLRVARTADGWSATVIFDI